MSKTQDENIFADGFSFGSWFTSRVLPWIVIVFLGGVGSIVYGYWNLSVKVEQLKQTRCCDSVDSNIQSIQELKRAVSILVKLHTDEGQTNGHLDDILNGWGSNFDSTAFEEDRDYRLEDGRSRQPFDRRGRYPDKATLTKHLALRDDKKRRRRY